MSKSNCTRKIPFQSFEKEFEKTHKNFSKKTNKKNNQKFAHNIYKFYKQNKFTPQNNFYGWVNDEYLKSIKIPKNEKYIVQYDDFRIVQNKVYLDLLKIVRDELQNGKKTKFYNNLKSFYKSCMKMSSLEQVRKNIKDKIKVIDELRENKENVWKMLAEFNKSELYNTGCPLVFGMRPDLKDPTKFRVFIDGPHMSLVNYDIFFVQNLAMEKYKRRFYHYINKLFDAVLGKGHGLDPEDVYNVEKKLIFAFGCNSEKEPSDNYSRITKEQALKHFQFDFEKFCKCLGFKTVPEWFISSDLNYLKCGTQILLQHWDTKEFRTYWIYNYLRHICFFCQSTRKILYDFYGKLQRGETRNFDETYIKGIFPLCLAFNNFLSNKYIDLYTNQDDIDFLKQIAEDLKAIFIRILNRNTWLDPRTKKYALMKLTHLNLVIGSPKIIRDDPVLPYSDNNLLENMNMLFDWRTNLLISLNEKDTDVPIPTIDWSRYPPKLSGEQCYIVNASYTPSKNKIYVNLGYLQSPFVDLQERGLEYNLAHLGFTLGHEMSHSLDDWGSQYDYLGRLHNWWQPEDKFKFKKIQADVLNQYTEFAKRDGIKYDASISLGEDMADISGLAITTEYLRDYHEYQKEVIPIQDLSFKKFFVYYAHQMKEKLSIKALEAQLLTNPHPLDQYRTNIPLSRQVLFRKVYNIQEKDKMWWHNTNTIW